MKLMKVMIATSLIMWIIIGVLVLGTPNPITKLEYALVWICLILSIIGDLLE